MTHIHSRIGTWGEAVAAAVLALLILEGCGSKCTAMACVPRVDVYFKSSLQEEGQYRVELDAGPAGRATCTTSVPVLPGARCTGTEASWIMTDSAGTSLTSPTPGSGALVVGVALSAQVSVIGVRIVRDETVVGEASIQPTYNGEENNGPGCGQCPVAVEHVDVP